jgi:heat shock protein HslJ
MPRMPSWMARPVSILLTVVSLAGCATTAPSPVPASEAPIDLPGTVWRLVSLGGVTPAGAAPTLELGTDGSATGSTGCNSFTGRYSIDGPGLAVSPLATTKRGCEPAIASQEMAFLAGMTGVTRWAIGTDGRLVLAGRTELVFERARPAWIVLGNPSG